MHTNDSSSDDENFQDALAAVPARPMTMTLNESIQDTAKSMDLFLNNKFSEASEKLQPYASQSMYHALGYSSILYMQAIFTYEMDDIKKALHALKNASQVFQKFRRKSPSGFSKFLTKAGDKELTDDEVHAELCYAECLLERSFLTFIQDESFVSFIKGGMKMRNCYQSYKICHKLLNERKWDHIDLKQQFESGVKMGIGAFNLFISQLPARILKLMEFLGFNGNKMVGLRELDEGYALKHTLRSPLCSAILLSYHAVISFILGSGDGDVEYAQKIVNDMLEKYPKGALFLYFSGRVEVIKGNIDEAISKFEESILVQHEWEQFHHICFWELVWCHGYKCNFKMGGDFSELLIQRSKWSKAIYWYMKAAFLIQDSSLENHKAVVKILNEVPNLRQRIAGKSLPLEKFVSKKACRYFDQGEMLALPALELTYIWNGYSMLAKQKNLVMAILAVVEKVEKSLERYGDKYKVDNEHLALFLRGVCLKYLDSPLQAEECFTQIYRNEKNVVEDLYLVPFSLLELGLLSLDAGDFTTAETLLEKARSGYKGYTLEGRLHFRVHSAMNRIKAESQNLTVPTDNPLPTPNPSPSRSTSNGTACSASNGHHSN